MNYQEKILRLENKAERWKSSALKAQNQKLRLQAELDETKKNLSQLRYDFCCLSEELDALRSEKKDQKDKLIVLNNSIRDMIYGAAPQENYLQFEDFTL